MKTFIIILSSAIVLSLTFFAGMQFPGDDNNSEQRVVSTQIADYSDPNIRTNLEDDGSRILWIRSEDLLRVFRFELSSSGNISSKREYRIDRKGNPMKCRIFDNTNTEVFKARYGYRMTDGLLVEEQIFDSKNKHLDRQQEEEVPIRRIVYSGELGATDPNPTIIELVSVELPNNLITAFLPFDAQGE